MRGWNLKIIATDPYLDPVVARDLDVELVPFEQLLSQSDIVSLHVPLLPETTHLLNDHAFGLLKRGAIIVNTARGAIIDQAALLRAIDSGRVNCAGLDVFEIEPLADDSVFRTHPRIVATDHMAWYSEESQLDLQRSAAREVVRACTGGLPEAIANPEVLQKLGRAHEWTPNHLARWQALRATRSTLAPA